MRLLIANGRVIDPSSGIDEFADVHVEDGKVVRLGTGVGLPPPDRTVEAAGLLVVPGLIDMHVHLREPGFEDKETIASGTRAAAKGGFTTVCCMPNTRPVNDSRRTLESILSEAKRSSPVNVLPVAAITKGLLGRELTDIAALAAAGAVAFSDDGRPVMDSRIMRSALEGCRISGTFVIDHCEDLDLSRGGVINRGRVSTSLGLGGIPADSETNIVMRDILLAEELKARIHIAHVTVRGAIDAVREAKTRGRTVSAEATPHHLLLTEDSLETGDADFKMNPPLRSRTDVEALVGAVRSGVIDVIATDHAPHTPEEKGQGLAKAPFGVIGLETAVSLILSRLVHTGIVSLNHFVELMSSNPANVLGLANKGRIAEGSDADMTLIDLSKEVIVDRNRFESKARNTPFNRWRLKGAAVMTIVGGRVVYPFESDSSSSNPKAA